MMYNTINKHKDKGSCDPYLTLFKLAQFESSVIDTQTQALVLACTRAKYFDDHSIALREKIELLREEIRLHRSRLDNYQVEEFSLYPSEYGIWMLLEAADEAIALANQKCVDCL